MDLDRQGYGAKFVFCDSDMRLKMVDNAWEK